MQRNEMLEKIRNADEPWDMIIIGGGATGLGAVLEAASRTDAGVHALGQVCSLTVARPLDAAAVGAEYRVRVFFSLLFSVSSS